MPEARGISAGVEAGVVVVASQMGGILSAHRPPRARMPGLLPNTTARPTQETSYPSCGE